MLVDNYPMFKDIGNLFEKRNKIIDKSQNKSNQIKNIVKDFLKERFRGSLKGYSFDISYNSQENYLIVTAENKILANELVLELVSLNDLLRAKNISLSKVLIR